MELALGLLNVEERGGVTRGKPELVVEVLLVVVMVPLWGIFEFELTLVEVAALVNVLVEPLGEDGDTGSLGLSDVRIRKKSRNKEARLSRLITVRVCCPLGSVGDLYASMVD